MCGIVAGVSRKKVMPILLEGLRRLEYRGYDSCGVAVIEGGAIRRARSVKRVQELAEQVEAEKLDSTVGIAHTRWATHGGPVVCNAHPHIAGGRIALVHNGIIENYAEIREELLSAGVTFESQTDTEVLAHLVNHYYEGDLLAAVERALNRVRGAYGIAVFCMSLRRAWALRWWWGWPMKATSLRATRWPWRAAPTALFSSKTAT